jgi:S1-C subfamily serine protease
MIPKKTIFELAAALGGIPILGTLPGSPASHAGIGYGDVLLWVNGQRTRTVLDYVEAKAIRTDGMEVVLFRAGEERTVRFDYDAAFSGRTDAASLLAQLVGMRVLGDEDHDN